MESQLHHGSDFGADNTHSHTRTQHEQTNAHSACVGDRDDFYSVAIVLLLLLFFNDCSRGIIINARTGAHTKTHTRTIGGSAE